MDNNNMIELGQQDEATVGTRTADGDNATSSIVEVPDSEVRRKKTQRNSIYILGEEIERDIESINMRLKYGEVLAPIFGFIGIVPYFIGNILYKNKILPILILTYICTAFSLFFVLIM